MRTYLLIQSVTAERPPVAKDSADALTLAQRISLAFDVSVEAATVRLAKLSYFTD